MYILTNGAKQCLCHPGTENPITFESYEDAQEFIDKTPVAYGANIEELVDEGVSSTERYGGDNDCW